MKGAPSIAIVTRPTRYQELMQRRVTAGAAKFRLAQAKEYKFAARSKPKKQESNAAVATTVVPDAADEAAQFEEYEREHRAYQATLQLLKRDLDFGFPLVFVEWRYIANFDFGRCVLVVVVGQDGLVANVAKYALELPLVAVNPDPVRYDGILLPFFSHQAKDVVRKVLADKADMKSISLAEVHLDDGQEMLAFNDFFVGNRTHVSARYTIRIGERAEPHSSSGVLISTGVGSTGWLSSVFNMMRGVGKFVGAKVRSVPQLEWDTRQLVWVVREPFRSRHSKANMVAGIIEEGDELEIESLMPLHGVIFSDGIESDYLEFNSGSIARISLSPKRARLVVQ